MLLSPVFYQDNMARKTNRHWKTNYSKITIFGPFYNSFLSVPLFLFMYCAILEIIYFFHKKKETLYNVVSSVFRLIKTTWCWSLYFADFMSMGDDRSICIFGPKSGIISFIGQFVTLSELDEEAKGVQEK